MEKEVTRILHMRPSFLLEFFISLFLLFYCSGQVFANDSIWLDKKWKPCAKEQARFLSISTRADSLFSRKILYWPEGAIYQEGSYADKNLSKLKGLLKTYSPDGQLLDSSIYVAGKPVYIFEWYEGGQKKQEIRSTIYPARLNSSVAWDKDGNESPVDSFFLSKSFTICRRDTAEWYEVARENQQGWVVYQTLVATDSTRLIKQYTDRTFKTQKWFAVYRQDHLRDSIIYSSNNRRSESWGYHSNGQLAFHVLNDSSGKPTTMKLWNEQGQLRNPIRYVKYAEPKEGFKSWQKKILRQINDDKSIPKKERKDKYGSVYIAFLVTDEGIMKEAYIRDPSVFPEMDAIILKACQANQEWKPCEVNGRRETFLGVHSFSFVKGKVIKYKTLY